MSREITPVVLSGGSGTRLWPLSLPARPKQLQALVGSETMLQATVDRTVGVADVTGPVVVCNEAQVEAVTSQLRTRALRSVVVEPVARNTAPAVAAAAQLLDPDTVLAVLPADHVIVDTAAFRDAMGRAVEAATEGSVVTFGIVPTRPETGFGYIESVEPAAAITDVVRFVEKPDPATAEEYLATGRFLWNSGMFVFTAETMRRELHRHAPEVSGAVTAAVATADRAAGVVRLGPAFADAPAISIDHAVMERTDRAVVVPLEAGWSDVGSWQALWEVTASAGETVTVGDVFALDADRSYIRSDSRPVAVIGVDDVVVVETDDAVLVVDRRRAQDVRAAAEWYAARREARPPPEDG